MPALVSPSFVVSGLSSTSSPVRSRANDEPQGRSFHSALDRSRAAQADAADEPKADGVSPRPGARRGPAAAKDDAPAEMPNLAFFTPALPAQAVVAAARAGADAQTTGALRDAAAATQRADAQTALASGAELPAGAPGTDVAQPAALAEGNAPALDDVATQGARKTFAAPAAAAAAAAPADAAGSPSNTTAASTAAPTASTDPALLGAALASTLPGGAAVVARSGRPEVASRDGAAGASAVGAAAGQADAAKSDPLQALAAAGVEASLGSDAGAANAQPDTSAAAWMAAQAASLGNTAPTDATSGTDGRVPVLSLAPPVDSDAWGPALGQQMLRMSASGMHTAQLNLNPANLGPLQITLKLGDDQAQAMFVSAHEGVRKAVEAALPQLRTTLAEHGISLGQTGVGADTRQPAGQSSFAGASSSSGRSGGQGGNSYPGSARATSTASDALPATPVRNVRSTSAVDTFA